MPNAIPTARRPINTGPSAGSVNQLASSTKVRKANVPTKTIANTFQKFPRFEPRSEAQNREPTRPIPTFHEVVI